MLILGDLGHAKYVIRNASMSNNSKTNETFGTLSFSAKNMILILNDHQVLFTWNLEKGSQQTSCTKLYW